MPVIRLLLLVGRLHMKLFILANGRTPRPQSFCAPYYEPIGKSYLREIAGRIGLVRLAVVGVIAGAALISACSQPSDSQQTAAQQQAAADEQAHKAADEKAWADAVRAGSATAFNAYVQNFGSGAHVAEARQRVAALEEQARKEADEKAWTEAVSAGTSAVFAAYVQNFGSGKHVADARRRLAALDAQARKEVPTVDIQKTCQAGA